MHAAPLKPDTAVVTGTDCDIDTVAITKHTEKNVPEWVPKPEKYKTEKCFSLHVQAAKPIETRVMHSDGHPSKY